MNDAIQPGELAFFSVLAAGRSLGAAARELGVTTAAVSKRLAQMEAAPQYLARHGEPRVPADLARHNCITIRQGGEGHGAWRLIARTGAGRRAAETVRTRGNLSANDGEVALAWALDGHGILMRAEWDVARHLASGALAPVLPDYHTPEADIYAVYAQRHRKSPRVSAFVDLLAKSYKSAAGDR